ncbi:MAG: VWA domain-containing protein, partial [Candidatus Omnitrophica bacterium]|nr:VWA domain-containing protein [Candidatus Omnitrophota bacterium]
AAGLRLGLAAFPVESQKRIVLFSDGNENRGTVLEEARRLAGMGIPVDVVPLEYQTEEEVYVEKIVYPNRVNEEEPIDVELYVNSRVDTPAHLRLFVQDELIRDQPVELKAGKNKFTVPSLELPVTKLYKLEVRVEAEADTSIENNRATGFVSVTGKPNILLVEGDYDTNPNAAEEFVAQIQSEGIDVQRIAPDQVPIDQSLFLSYDAIILSNVNAADLSEDQMNMIERLVHDIGIGLVMVGGEESFGAGGYRGTPIEKALPVSTEIREKKIIPSGALVVVLHTCEIPNGNNLMRQVAIESIRVLDPHDEVGMLDYDYRYNGVHWIFDLEKKGDGRRQVALIKRASPGDMPDFGSAMKLGFNSLKLSTSNLRHMVILSDGDPQPPSRNLLADFKDNGITVSTVLIGGHGGNFLQVMNEIAKTTGGRFYDVKNANKIPRIFAREAATIKRNLIVEEAFQPIQVADTELTESFDPSGYPALLGYVLTSSKAGAETPLLTHQEDPLLAHWRYGLGKSVAFTSDFKPKWAPNWIEWNGYGQFWAQAIRWVARKEMSGNYQVSTYQEEGKGRIVVDAFNDDNEALNYLTFNGKVLTPDQGTIPVRLVQTDLGRYEAEFDLDTEGTYLVNLFDESDEGDSGTLTTALSVPYSPEYMNDRSNTRLLKQIAEVTQGRYEPASASFFDHSLVAHAKPFPLWPWLVGLAIVLFWFDVFVRRVLLDMGDIRNGLAYVGSYLRPRRRTTEESASTMEALKRTKEASHRPGKGKAIEREAPIIPERKFDFDALEKKKAEGVSLEKPEGRKAAPSKREPTDAGQDRPAGGSTTDRLLDLKRKMNKKKEDDS